MLTHPAAGGMSERRRHRLRLEISREASRLFWEHGVAATSGDRIAEAVGLSTRTIWRHFRSKESCAEPIVIKGVAWGTNALRSWPRHLSLDDHLAAEAVRYESAADDLEHADTLLAIKMIRLADHEPLIRTAWLMACDHVACEMTTVIANRLGLPADDFAVRLHGAAASAAFRVVNEELGVAVLRGVVPEGFEDDVIRRLARAVRDATGGAIGDAISDASGDASAPADAELRTRQVPVNSIAPCRHQLPRPPERRGGQAHPGRSEPVDRAGSSG
ncbi:helix-turn-helix domain-containing protein [Streptomyces sp. NPDC059142]|uniref:TetR/AcrR family transcriptional regulator n=1 Tax=Streptomyces sp. NPDC059142 TaxID=3346739 RepID=UPI0036B76204